MTKDIDYETCEGSSWCSCESKLWHLFPFLLSSKLDKGREGWREFGLYLFLGLMLLCFGAMSWIWIYITNFCFSISYQSECWFWGKPYPFTYCVLFKFAIWWHYVYSHAKTLCHVYSSSNFMTICFLFLVLDSGHIEIYLFLLLLWI